MSAPVLIDAPNLKCILENINSGIEFTIRLSPENKDLKNDLTIFERLENICNANKKANDSHQHIINYFILTRIFKYLTGPILKATLNNSTILISNMMGPPSLHFFDYSAETMTFWGPHR